MNTRRPNCLRLGMRVVRPELPDVVGTIESFTTGSVESVQVRWPSPISPSLTRVAAHRHGTLLEVVA